MKKPVQFKLPPAMLDRLAKLAKQYNTSKTQLVEEALALLLDKYERALEKKQEQKE